MEALREYLDYPLGDYMAYDYAYAAAIFVGIVVGFWVLKAIIVAHLKRLAKNTDNTLDDHAVDILDDVSAVFYFVVALYFASRPFDFSENIDSLMQGVFLVVVVWQATRSLIKFIEYILLHVSSSATGEPKFSRTMVSGVKFIVSLVFWSVAFLLILSNLGFNITSLAASLGIGGIAVALAVQNILSDIFASFSIYFDRPFDIGDFVTVGDTDGTIKKIGLKTTRIQSLQGEEVIVSNKELTNSKIQNFGRMKERRMVATFGVIYDTPSKKLEKIPGVVEKTVDTVEMATFNRCHFVNFGDSALEFELVYFVDSPVYLDAMNTTQSVLLGIKKAFEKAKIEMAFPTQTVYVKK